MASKRSETPAVPAIPAIPESAAASSDDNLQASARAAAYVADGHIDPQPIVIPSVFNPLATIEDEQKISMEAADPQPHVGHLLIVSAKPGFWRGGVQHPARATYPLDFFTAAQLAAIRAEPVLELVEIDGAAIPRQDLPLPYGTAPRLDVRTAGQAAADAISKGPTRAEPGLRNAVAGAAGFVTRG